MAEWDDVKDYLVKEARDEEFEEGFDSPDSLYDRSVLFEKSEGYEEEGTKYELDAVKSSNELVELLGEDFSIETDAYPDVEQFGYSMEDDRFTLESEDSKKEYQFAAEDSGHHSAIGVPFDDQVWELYAEPGEQVNGVKRDGSEPCDLSDSAVANDLELMADTVDQVERKLYEDKKNILFTSNYRQDVDRLERGEELGMDSKKIRDADANLNLKSVTPRMAMTKKMSGSLDPLIQFKHERESLRGLFVEGFRFAETEDDKVYAVTLLDKDSGEQDRLSKKIGNSSNDFFQDAKSYARHVLEEDGVI